MDWHITETATNLPAGLAIPEQNFPEPEQFIQQLHQRDLKTALNLHPAEGVILTKTLIPLGYAHWRRS